MHSAYVNAVKATGAPVRIKSRWLNGVSIHANAAQIEAVAGLPFVEKIQPVLRAQRTPDLREQPATGDSKRRAAGVIAVRARRHVERLEIHVQRTLGAARQRNALGLLHTGAPGRADPA